MRNGRAPDGYLQPLSRRGRPRTHPSRRILDAIFCVLRTGCPWRYLPTNFPPWQTVSYHFRQFRRKNTLHALYPALHRAERARVGRHPDSSAAIVDNQSVKTVEESGGIRGYDGGKLVKGRKRRLLVDTLGPPIAWYVAPADPSARAGSWAGSRSSCRASRRSGRTPPTAARSWPAGAESKATAGNSKSWSANPVSAASPRNRAVG
jgi:transposase